MVMARDGSGVYRIPTALPQSALPMAVQPHRLLLGKPGHRTGRPAALVDPGGLALLPWADRRADGRPRPDLLRHLARRATGTAGRRSSSPASRPRPAGGPRRPLPARGPGPGRGAPRGHLHLRGPADLRGGDRSSPSRAGSTSRSSTPRWRATGSSRNGGTCPGGKPLGARGLGRQLRRYTFLTLEPAAEPSGVGLGHLDVLLGPGPEARPAPRRVSGRITLAGEP